jgi:hypothetical protein
MATVGKDNVWFEPGGEVVCVPNDYIEKLFLQDQLAISDKCPTADKVAFLKKIGKYVEPVKPDGGKS